MVKFMAGASPFQYTFVFERPQVIDVEYCTLLLYISPILSSPGLESGLRHLVG